jgi:hypothetical protein
MRRSLIVVLTVVLAAVFVSSAAATVRLAKRPGRVSRGDSASVTVVVSPKARCRIGVYWSSRKSEASGLEGKTGKKITWTWRVASNTNPGTWPIKIDCGKSGKTQTRITVR